MPLSCPWLYFPQENPSEMFSYWKRAASGRLFVSVLFFLRHIILHECVIKVQIVFGKILRQIGIKDFFSMIAWSWRPLQTINGGALLPLTVRFRRRWTSNIPQCRCRVFFRFPFCISPRLRFEELFPISRPWIILQNMYWLFFEGKTAFQSRSCRFCSFDK